MSHSFQLTGPVFSCSIKISIFKSRSVFSCALTLASVSCWLPPLSWFFSFAYRNRSAPMAAGSKKNKPPKINRRKVMKLPVWFGVLSSLFLCSNPAFLGGGSPSPPQWGSTATLNGRGTRNLTLVFQVFVADLAYCFYSSAAELETTPKKKNLVSFFIEKMSTRFGRNCYDLIPLCFSFQTRSS